MLIHNSEVRRMANDAMTNREETLDPQDWKSMRDLGHRMIDDMMNYLEHVRERPVWRPLPVELNAELYIAS